MLSGQGYGRPLLDDSEKTSAFICFTRQTSALNSTILDAISLHSLRRWVSKVTDPYSSLWELDSSENSCPYELNKHHIMFIGDKQEKIEWWAVSVQQSCKEITHSLDLTGWREGSKCLSNSCICDLWVVGLHCSKDVIYNQGQRLTQFKH